MVQGLEAKTFGRRYYFEKEEIFDWEMAVLVAVSIPIFTRQLEKSREATDRANLRAANAAAVTALLDDATISRTIYYDAVHGILVADAPANGYGKGTALAATDADTEYTPSSIYQGGYIRVVFANGGATLKWMGGSCNATTEVKIDPTEDVFYPTATP